VHRHRQECETPLDLALDADTRAALGGVALRGAAAAAVSVPADVDALLSRLSLSDYGPALVSKLGVRSVSAANHATDDELASVGMTPLQRRMLKSALHNAIMALI
jgi:hypothetical protein